MSTVLVGRELTSASGNPGRGVGLPVFGNGQRTDLPAPEKIVSYMDGERYAQVAVDPLLRDAAADFPGDPKTAAYIASKPLMSWLGWIASGGGRATNVAWAMIVLTVLSAAALVAALATLAGRLGREPLWASVAVLTPGVLAVLMSPGEGDLIAAALVLTGLVWWMDERAGWAVAAFVLAALGRETMLVVPAALLAKSMISRRRAEWRLLMPFAVYASWFAYVRARTGELPTTSAGGSLRLVVGLVDSVSYWGPPEYLSISLLVALSIAAWRSLPSDWRLIVLAYAASMLTFGTETGAFWWAFGRVLLPAYLLTLVVLLPRATSSPALPDGVHQAVP